VKPSPASEVWNSDRTFTVEQSSNKGDLKMAPTDLGVVQRTQEGLFHLPPTELKTLNMFFYIRKTFEMRDFELARVLKSNFFLPIRLPRPCLGMEAISHFRLSLT
jgi:hypothetical protein